MLKFYIVIIILFQSFLIYGESTETDNQLELSKYIVEQVEIYQNSKSSVTSRSKLIPLKSENRYGISGDTLFIPKQYFGFSSTNNYGLHFYTSLFLNFEKYFKKDSIHSNESLFLNSGRASLKVLEYLNTIDSGKVLNSLLIKEYVYSPLEKNDQNIEFSKFMSYKEKNLYLSILQSILYYRLDSLNFKSYLYDQNFIDYSIISVSQDPSAWKTFDIDIKLRNLGNSKLPFKLLLDLSNGSKEIDINGFEGDTIISLQENASVLKVIIDPYMQIPDFKRDNQQFVSSEFSNKRRAYQAFAALLWNFFSALVAFIILSLIGIMVHSVTHLFYSSNYKWVTVYVTLFVMLKVAMPLMLIGFNMWGFVYFINTLAVNSSTAWIMVSLSSVSLAVYWAFTKDGVNMEKLSTFMKYILVVIFLEPIIFSLGL